MELVVIEEDKNKLVAEIKGASHTVCNAIKVQLWDNPKVKAASYSVRHPLVGDPRFVVETDGTVKPQKALADAATKLQTVTAELKKEFKKVK